MAREKFLNNFNLISRKFSKNIAVYYISDLQNTTGISFHDLNQISDESSCYLSRIFGKKFQYIGVSCRDYCLLPCIILSIWKSGYAFAGLGNQYTHSNNLKFLDFLKINYLISDSREKYGEVIDEFCILNRKFFILQRKVQGDIETKDMCYGIMTSGSTGEAKIIQVPWSCIISNVMELADRFSLTEFDCVFLASPCSFDPFFVELLFSFLKGCSVMIVANEIKLCSAALLQALFLQDNKPITETQFSDADIQKQNVTVLQMTPSVFKRWKDDDIKNTILGPETSLRILVLGGERFPNEILKLKSSNNQTRIFNIYGITEISCWAFLNEVTACCPDTDISLGQPLNSITFQITEKDELFLGSPSRKCLVDNEKLDDELVYRNTGDLAKLKNNELFYIGRSNQVVKKYGMKISLAKIEASFLSYNLGIKECYCVYDDLNAKTGLFYLSEEYRGSYEVHSVENLKQKGFDIPRDYLKDVEMPDLFIEIPQPPINSHGKCDRAKLKQFLQSLKTSANPDIAETFSKIWIEVLGVESCKLSFKESGGSSIQALSLMNKLTDAGFKVPQDFIAELLSNGCYETCLNVLKSAQDTSTPKKRKIGEVADDVGIFVKWKFDLGKCIDATPTIFTYKGKERVIVGSHSHKLTCLDADSRSEIWTILLGDRIESGFTISNDNTKGFIGCYDHFVYCIDTSTGSIVWKYKTDEMVKSTPCLSSNGNRLFVASYDKHLHCLSVEDGQLITKLKISDGGIFSSGKVSDVFNTYYIGTLDGTCIALDQATNETKWKTKLQTPIFSSPCLINRDSRIVFAEVLGVVHCFDAVDGTRVWSYQAGGNIYSSPLEVNSSLIFGCHDGNLYCLHNGPELKWKQEMDSAIFAKPSQLLDMICVATTKGFVYLCDFVTGIVKARVELGGEVFSSPVTINQRVFVGCRDNYVYSLQVSDENK